MLKGLKKNKKGFTLIELIVVIAIIAILAAVAIPNYIAVQNRAEEAVAQGNAAVIAQAINTHNTLNTSSLITSAPADVATFNSTSDVSITMSDADYTAALAFLSIDASGNATVLEEAAS